MSSILKLLLLFIACSAIKSDFESLEKTCTPIGAQFTTFKDPSKPMDWNMREAFVNGVFMVKSKFEEIKYVHFPGHSPEYVLVRKTLIGSFDLKAFELAYKLGLTQSSAEIYGCQVGGKEVTPGYVYVVKQLLQRNFDFDSTKALIQSKKRSQFVALVKDLFENLSKVNAKNWIHNNVRPSTVFINDEANKTFLTGFGLIQRKSVTPKALGVPFFMSPKLFNKSYKNEQEDDNYSAVLLFAGILAENSYDDVYAKAKSPYVGIDKKCFLIKNPRNDRAGKDLENAERKACIDVIKGNVVEILKKAHFGEDTSSIKKSPANTENLTTLFAKILDIFNNPPLIGSIISNLNYLEGELAKEEENDDNSIINSENREKALALVETSRNAENEMLEAAKALIIEDSNDGRDNFPETLKQFIASESVNFFSSQLYQTHKKLFFNMENLADMSADNYHKDSAGLDFKDDEIEAILEGYKAHLKEASENLDLSGSNMNSNKPVLDDVSGSLGKLAQSSTKGSSKNLLESSIKASLTKSLGQSTTGSKKYRLLEMI